MAEGDSEESADVAELQKWEAEQALQREQLDLAEELRLAALDTEISAGEQEAAACQIQAIHRGRRDRVKTQNFQLVKQMSAGQKRLQSRTG